METLRWGEGLRPGRRPRPSQVYLSTSLPTSEPLAVPTLTPSPGCFGSAPGRAGQGSVPPRGDPRESSPGRWVQPVKGTSGPGVKWSSLGPGPQLVWHRQALPWSLSGPPPTRPGSEPPLPIQLPLAWQEAGHVPRSLCQGSPGERVMDSARPPKAREGWLACGLCGRGLCPLRPGPYPPGAWVALRAGPRASLPALCSDAWPQPASPARAAQAPQATAKGHPAAQPLTTSPAPDSWCGWMGALWTDVPTCGASPRSPSASDPRSSQARSSVPAAEGLAARM